MRFASFTHFLLRELMPEHDRLCKTEGELMLDYLAGIDGAADRLAALKGRTESYLRSCYDEA